MKIRKIGRSENPKFRKLKIRQLRKIGKSKIRKTWKSFALFFFYIFVIGHLEGRKIGKSNNGKIWRFRSPEIRKFEIRKIGGSEKRKFGKSESQKERVSPTISGLLVCHYVAISPTPPGSQAFWPLSY